MMGIISILLVAFIGFLGFLLTPLSNVLNVITVPLGYQYISCPCCLDITIREIEYENCDNCGQEHATNWGASWYTGGEDGDKYYFCDSDCLQEFKHEVSP